MNINGIQTVHVLKDNKISDNKMLFIEKWEFFIFLVFNVDPPLKLKCTPVGISSKEVTSVFIEVQILIILHTF